MLRIDIRDLLRGPVRTDFVLAPDHEALEGLDVPLDGPLTVQGLVARAADGNHIWEATLSGVVTGACRRCLEEVRTGIDGEIRVVFSSDPDLESDPAVYSVDPAMTALDLGVAVREELALLVPAFPLCRESCAGLCARCGMDLNVGACRCGAPDDLEVR